MDWRPLVLLLLPVAALAAGVSCTNPFPTNPVPYDTAPWDSGDSGLSETDDSDHTDETDVIDTDADR